uniref:Uncharacterized protein n=1 Tax=Rhizophagus irregularis (strain DAOM 181602 / DAOM 197198 / MUCL 43194) TaxID=747089 RepID=U9UL29_RHIID
MEGLKGNFLIFVHIFPFIIIPSFYSFIKVIMNFHTLLYEKADFYVEKSITIDKHSN